MILWGDFFKISFSNFSCQYLENTVSYCLLTMYPAALLNSFLSSRSFYFSGFSTQVTIFSTNKGRFTYSFLFAFLFLFLPYNTITTMLNKSGEKRHSYFVPELTEKAFSLLPLSLCKLQHFLQIPLFKLRQFPSLSSQQCVCYKRVLNFVKFFFCIC